MKLRTFAKKTGISYQTAWKLFDKGQISGYKLGTGTIIITELDNDNKPPKVAIYVSIWCVNNQDYKGEVVIGLDDYCNEEVKKLTDYCTSHHWVVSEVVVDWDRNDTDTRIGLRKILADTSITMIVASSAYDLAPYGFDYLELLLKQRGCRIELIEKNKKLSKPRSKAQVVQDLFTKINFHCLKYCADKGEARIRARKAINIIDPDD